jgi:dTDP-4-amino-4,6-dideoxygalactose transaminase
MDTDKALFPLLKGARLALEAENIEARPIWKPMHLQPVFRVAGRKIGGLRQKNKNQTPYPARLMGGAVAEDLFNRGRCLPSGTQLTEKDLDRITRLIRKQAVKWEK